MSLAKVVPTFGDPTRGVCGARFWTLLLRGLVLALITSVANGCEDQKDLLLVNPWGVPAEVRLAGSGNLVCTVPPRSQYLLVSEIYSDDLAGPYSVYRNGRLVESLDAAAGTFKRAFHYRQSLVVLNLGWPP